MKRILLTIVCTWWIMLLSAQSLLTPIGRNAGMGAYSRHFQDVMTAYMYPAALSCLPALTGGIYAESRFLLKAVSLYSVMAAIPAGAGAFGIGLTRLGNDTWYQQKFSGAYGRTLGHRIGIGLRFNYETIAVSNYGKAGMFSFDAGMLWHISEKIHAGWQVGKTAGMPVIYCVGGGFEASRDFLLSAEMNILGNNIPCMKTTACYRIAGALALQLGIASQPPYNNVGMMVHWRAWYISMAASFHPQLGITPSTTIIWQAPQQLSAE